jgi:transcriptional regulator with XRE-family HTH domain
MAISNFKAALNSAGLTVEQFAEIVDVDPKTVRRWATGRVPYPRHRVTIARALDSAEHELWPDQIPAPATPDDEPTDVQPATARVCEVVATWGSSRNPGTPNVQTFLADTHQRIDVLDPSSGISRSPRLVDHLRQHAGAGCEVRVLIDRITPELASLAGQRAVELRTLDLSLVHTVLRADDQMLLGLRLVGEDSIPLFEVHRHLDGGLFDQLVNHYARAWDIAHPLPDAVPADHDPGSQQTPGTQSSARRWPNRSD